MHHVAGPAGGQSWPCATQHPTREVPSVALQADHVVEGGMMHARISLYNVTSSGESFRSRALFVKVWREYPLAVAS